MLIDLNCFSQVSDVANGPLVLYEQQKEFLKNEKRQYFSLCLYKKMADFNGKRLLIVQRKVKIGVAHLYSV